jgi:N-acyl-D-amino-acid deacylase
MEITYLLKNGLLVDGSGQPSYVANVLMQEGRLSILDDAGLSGLNLDDVSQIDCTGKVIAPGFIDVHSHMDYFAITDAPENFDPLVAQGITTMVVGNCGFSPFGFKCGTPHQHLIENSLFKEGHGDISWSSFLGYQEQIGSYGTRPNLLSLVGHGVCRTSLNGFSSDTLTDQQYQEMLSLLDESLSQGAAGVSLGLQYKPGVFASMDELKDVARLVKKHDKVLTVHAKAYSVLSGTYPMNPFGKAHNLRAIDEMLDLARETGVKLQFSHLIFVGKKTWPTLQQAIAKFDQAIADGVDVKFDMFPYPFGATLLNTILPEWVMANMPGILRKTLPMLRLRFEAFFGFKSVGLGYDCIQITDACCDAYRQYNGLFVSEIAQQVGKGEFDVMLDILDQSNAEARVMFHRYYNDEIIQTLMQHPAALFMTDSWPEPSGVENAATFGAFPKFLQIARDSGNISLESIITRMTKEAVDRFGIKERGLIKDGYIADVVVFDWNAVQDNTSRAACSAPPTGIEHVFVNGVWSVKNGQAVKGERNGDFLKVAG